MGIKNDGRATAKYPYLKLKVNKPYKISHSVIDGNRNTGLPVLPQRFEERTLQFGGSSNRVIHPGTVLEVTSIKNTFSVNVRSIEDVNIESEINAEDFLPFGERTVIKGEEIREILNI